MQGLGDDTVALLDVLVDGLLDVPATSRCCLHFRMLPVVVPHFPAMVVFGVRSCFRSVVGTLLS